MGSTSIFSSIMTVISDFMIFLIATISTKSFFAYITNQTFCYEMVCFEWTVNGIIPFLSFFQSWLFFLHVLLNPYKTFHTVFTSITIKLLFCCIKQTMCKQWMTRRCMFIYFSCWWLFRIIIISAHFLKKDSISAQIINGTFIDFSLWLYFNISLSSLGIFA